MKAFVPFKWAVNRLDVHIVLVILGSLAVFYRIESFVGDVWVSAAYALIPAMMWVLGAKFVPRQVMKASSQRLS